jgi:hypothetical protein
MAEIMMRRLRVALIVDDAPQSSACWGLIQRSKNAKNYSIEFLVVQRKPKKVNSSGLVTRVFRHLRQHGLKSLTETAGFLAIAKVEKLRIPHDEKYHEFYRSYGLDDIEMERVYVRPLISKSGFVYRYADDDIQKIVSRNPDVLIRCGSGILRGRILEAAPFGILSFHHADNEVNRGTPAGFWEVFNREPSTGFIIQRLSTELDGGDVLFKGAMPTSPPYVLNAMRLYLKANVFMHDLLERVGETGTLPDAHRKAPYAHQLYRTPALGEQIKYVLKTLARSGNGFVDRVRGKTLRWGVAYQFVDDWKSAVLWRSTVIRNPPNRYLADPFVLHKNGSHVCLVEDYDYSTNRAHITAFKIDREGYVELGCALKEDFHLSFPFVFEESSDLYMCPETQAAREIRLYKCVSYPLGWKLHRVLMKGVSAADTMLLKHEGKWWMLTNIDSSESGDHCSELHVFYADGLDSANWTPHPMNPVIFDSRRARNGGLLFDGDGIYRVFQVQGFGVYGESMGIARITELTTARYEEQVLYSITPSFFAGLMGTHTYSFAGGLLAVDFVKNEARRD